MFNIEFNYLKSNKIPIYKKCFDENNEEYDGAFCPYCGQQMFYCEGYLKTPLINEEEQKLAFCEFLECIQNEELPSGCGAKFSIDNKEIGYYEDHKTFSCSSVLFPEYNKVRVL